MTATPHSKSWLELDSARCIRNLAGIRRLVGSAEIMAVLKANAYGAGAVPIAGILAGAGVERFAVATVDEAASLRESGISGQILCLTYFDEQDTDAICEHALTVTVFSGDAVSLLDGAAEQRNRRLPVWVKVDTGLARLGVPLDEARGFIEKIARDTSLDITGIYSTLTENPARDRVQLERLLSLRSELESRVEASWSVASSNGILSLPESYLDVVRPGVMLLGFLPSEPERMDAGLVAKADIACMVTWKTRVATIKRVPAGEQVGYGERQPLRHDTLVASLMVGWSDGYSVSPECHAHVLIGERHCPVITVSANSTLVDVSTLARVQSGDEVVLLGRRGHRSIAVEELAPCAGGVYRMLAGIPTRIPRIRS